MSLLGPVDLAQLDAWLAAAETRREACRRARLAQVSDDGRTRCGAEDTPDEYFGPCHQPPGHGGRHQDYAGYCWDVAPREPTHSRPHDHRL